MSLRIFIPTKGRSERISTHKYFPSANIVVHDEAEAYLYRNNSSIDPRRILVSGTEPDAYGLTQQREWVCEHVAKKNEWIIFADDNIRYLISVDELHYGAEYSFGMTKEDGAYWRPIFNASCDSERFVNQLAPETVKYCGRIGAHLAGFATTDNIQFRKKKFRDAGYVIGKLMLWHNTGEVPFDHTITMEDFYHTAEHLKRYGVCVVNTYVFPRSSHYQSGGMGTYEQRVPYRREDVKNLLRRYPGMFRVKDREGFAPGTDLQLLLHSREAVIEWKRVQSRRLI